MNDANKKGDDINIAVIITVGLYILLTILTVAISFNVKTLMAFCREDSVYEWAQAILLLIAAIMSFFNFIIVRGKREVYSYFSLLFGLFCLFVFLEEISYGQRIFGLKSPYYFDRFNVHHEINLHNLPMFDNASEVAIVVIMVVWGIILPIVLIFQKEWRNFVDRKGLYTPIAIFAFFNIIGLFLEFLNRFIYPPYWADSNAILELYLYLTFFGVAFCVLTDRVLQPDNTKGGELSRKEN